MVGVAEDGIRDVAVTGVQTCALPIWFGTATDIDRQKHTEEAQKFLVNASTLLISSLDYQETMINIARLAVPFFADLCRVDILNRQEDKIGRASCRERV